MYRFLIVLIFTSSLLFGSNYTSKLLGDLNGNILIKENIDEIHPFASLTKLMTAVLAVEAVEKGEINYSDMVTIPKEAQKNKGSSIYLTSGQKVKVIDLLYATLVHSANDAAYTLAYYVSKGDLNSFVESMNKKAIEIGMENTTFCTPNGLPTSMTGKGMDRGTAKDIYKLSVYVLKKPKLVEVAGTEKISILNNKITIINRNHLLGKVDGVFGLKTGFHDLAKYNMSVAFKKNDEEYVTVLFGGQSANIRDKEVEKIIREFTPNKPKENVTYINENINLYKKNNSYYTNDKVSVIRDVIKNGKEIDNSIFDKPIVIN